MKALLAALLLAVPASADHIAGGGAATLSSSLGEIIHTAQPVPGGINGQIVLRRLAPDGGVYWEQRFGRGRREEPSALAASPDGGVVLAGPYKGGCFVARFDSQGRPTWDATPVNTGVCNPAGVVIDAEGSVYLLAAITGSAGFDAMVWKLSNRGDVLWTYRYATTGSAYPQNLYLDPRGDRVRAYVLRKSGMEYVEEFFRLDSAGRRL